MKYIITCKGIEFTATPAPSNIPEAACVLESATVPTLAEIKSAWMADFNRKKLSDSIVAGEAHLSKWFWGSRLTDMAVMYLQALTAVAGDQTALAAAKPILSSLHTWVYSVRSAAANGQRMFPQPPHTYEEFVKENH